MGGIEAIDRSRLKDFIRSNILEQSDFILHDDTSLIQGGYIDSFALLAIAQFIEDESGIAIADEDMTVENMDTIDAMVSMLNGSQGRARNV